MALIPAPNVMQVEMVFLYLGETVENVFHLQFPDAIIESDFDAVMSTFTTWEGAGGHDRRPSTVQLYAIIMTDLTTADSVRQVRPLAAPIPGGRAFAQLPNNNTLAIQLVTSSRGRGTQGRLFHIGLDEEQVSGNAVLPAAASDILDAYILLLSSIEEDTRGVWAVLHSRADGADLNPRTTTPVTGLRLSDLTIDTQDSRLPGHRRHKRASTPIT